MSWIQNMLVGVLFFGAMAIVGYFTVFSESGPFAKKGQKMVLFFDNAEGLKVGARVTVLGVPSGAVSEIALVAVDAKRSPVPEDDPAKIGHRVAVTIELKQPVVFYDTYNIAVKNETLLSGRVVSIDPGTARPLANGRVPHVIPVVAFSAKELSEKGKSALETTLAMRSTTPQMTDLHGETPGDPLAGLAELISENRDDIRKTIANIADITTKINTGKGTIGLLINDDELHRNANTLVTDAQIVVRELRESLEDTREQAPVNSFIRAALTAF